MLGDVHAAISCPPGKAEYPGAVFAWDFCMGYDAGHNRIGMQDITGYDAGHNRI